MAGEKKLSQDRQDAARTFIRAIVEKDFGGNVTQAAKRFGVAQSMLSEFLAGGRGAGTKLLSGVADYAHVTWDEIVGRSGGSSFLMLRQHSDWERVVALASEQHRGEIEEQFFRDAGEWSSVTGLPERIDVPFVAALARELQALARRDQAFHAPAKPIDRGNGNERTGTVSKIPKAVPGSVRKKSAEG